MSEPTLKALALELAGLEIPASHYSLGTARDERTCLVPLDGKWAVFYSERGRMDQLCEYADFDKAKAELLGRLQ